MKRPTLAMRFEERSSTIRASASVLSTMFAASCTDTPNSHKAFDNFRKRHYNRVQLGIFQQLLKRKRDNGRLRITTIVAYSVIEWYVMTQTVFACRECTVSLHRLTLAHHMSIILSRQGENTGRL
jgi:predicted Zn-dependent protease